MYITPAWTPPRKAPDGELNAPDNPRGLQAALALMHISGRTNPGGHRERPLTITQDELSNLRETYPVFQNGVTIQPTSAAFFQIWEDKSIIMGKWDGKDSLSVLPIVLRARRMPHIFQTLSTQNLHAVGYNIFSNNIFSKDFDFWEPHIDAQHSISGRFMSHTPPTWMSLNWINTTTTQAWEKLTQQAAAWVALQAGELDKTYHLHVEPRSLSLNGVRAPQKGFQPRLSVSGLKLEEIFSSKFSPALAQARSIVKAQIKTQPCFQGTNFVKQDARHHHMDGDEHSRNQGVCAKFTPSSTSSHTVIKLAQEFMTLMEPTT